MIFACVDVVDFALESEPEIKGKAVATPSFYLIAHSCARIDVSNLGA